MVPRFDRAYAQELSAVCTFLVCVHETGPDRASLAPSKGGRSWAVVVIVSRANYGACSLGAVIASEAPRLVQAAILADIANAPDSWTCEIPPLDVREVRRSAVEMMVSK